MAKASRELIYALRKTVVRLHSGAPYQWGHLGSCNCGHLAQTLTHKSKGEIHSEALKRVGDWGDVSAQYCETSGLPIDDIIGAMLEVGLNLNDIGHLENLSDRKILSQLPAPERCLKHNNRNDVITYLSTWADLLESQLQEPPSNEPKGQLSQEAAA
jgi:hypothetical protein